MVILGEVWKLPFDHRSQWSDEINHVWQANQESVLKDFALSQKISFKI